MRDLVHSPPAIAPIPTRYKAIEFRSKLEASVAQVLDAAGVPWTYEQEGYQIDPGGPRSTSPGKPRSSPDLSRNESGAGQWAGVRTRGQPSRDEPPRVGSCAAQELDRAGGANPESGPVWYLPDFFLPAAEQFVEVKGPLDDPSLEKPIALSRALGPGRVIVIEHAATRWHLGSAHEIVGRCLVGPVSFGVKLFRCRACGLALFLSVNNQSACPSCGGTPEPLLVRAEHRRGQTTYSPL